MSKSPTTPFISQMMCSPCAIIIYIIYVFICVFQTIVSSEEKCKHKLRTKLQKNTKKVNNGKHMFCSLSCLFRLFFQYSIFETLLFWTLCWAVVLSDSLMQFHIVFTKHVSNKNIVIIVQNWNGEHTRTGCVSNSEPNYHIEANRSNRIMVVSNQKTKSGYKTLREQKGTVRGQVATYFSLQADSEPTVLRVYIYICI